MMTMQDQAFALLPMLCEEGNSPEDLRLRIQELERRLAQQKAQLDGAKKELDTLSYSISHDLRAPLRHVLGFGRLLFDSQESTFSARDKEHLETILNASKQMERMIDGLLGLSRLVRVELHCRKVDVQELAGKVIQQLQAETEGRHVAWKQGLIPPVYADPSLLWQALTQLLLNAVKFTRPRDGAEIEIGCSLESTSEAVLFVRDNGIGFEMKHAEDIFNVFSRLHRDEFAGMGTGLAIVRCIAARHGGRAWAEGMEDGGATFYISFPGIGN